jgi:hypothetical protein
VCGNKGSAMTIPRRLVKIPFGAAWLSALR